MGRIDEPAPLDSGSLRSDTWYEAWHIGDPSVVQKDGKFYMAYSATSKSFGEVVGYPATIIQCVMGAVSDDGVNWQKTSQPLLIRAEDQMPPVPDPNELETSIDRASNLKLVAGDFGSTTFSREKAAVSVMQRIVVGFSTVMVS